MIGADGGGTALSVGARRFVATEAARAGTTGRPIGLDSAALIDDVAGTEPYRTLLAPRAPPRS